MNSRFDPYKAAPVQMKLWTETGMKIAPSIEASLQELIKIRASQINGCANCLHMHTADARKGGETEQRLYLLSAWHDAPCFTPRERAALAWTDALTQISTQHAPDAIYAALAEQFSDAEQVEVTLLINIINGWNRIAIGFDLFYEGGKSVVAAA